MAVIVVFNELFEAEALQISVKNMELIGGLAHFLFFHKLGIIIPIDFHIFQTG